MVDYSNAYRLIEALQAVKSTPPESSWVNRLMPAPIYAPPFRSWSVKDASQAVELNRELGALMRGIQQEKVNAESINQRYLKKKNSRDPDDVHDVKRITDVRQRLDDLWQNIQLKYAPVLRLVPAETVRGLDKYITNNADRPTPSSYVHWIEDVYEWLYQIIKTVNSLKQERKQPRRLMQLKPSERYAGNHDVYNDFGSLLQEAERGLLMAQHDEPHASEEQLETLVGMPDRQPASSGMNLTEGQGLFVRHHLNRIRAIQSDWQKINQGVLQIVKKDANDMALLADELNERTRDAPYGGTEANPIEWGTYAGGFIEGYRDLVDIALPLTRSLTNKYMIASPTTEGRTFKQVRQYIIVWYKAVLERAVRLYQFLGKYMGFRSALYVPSMKKLTWLARFTDGQVFVDESGIVQPYDVGGRVGDFVAYHVTTPDQDENYRGVVVGWRNKQLVVKPTTGAPKPLPDTLAKPFSDFSVVTPREHLPGRWAGKPTRPLNAPRQNVES